MNSSVIATCLRRSFCSFPSLRSAPPASYMGALEKAEKLVTLRKDRVLTRPVGDEGEERGLPSTSVVFGSSSSQL